MRLATCLSAHAALPSMAAAMLVLAAATGQAQSPERIVVAAGTSATITVQPNGRFSAPLRAEIPSAAPANLAALTAVLRWDPAQVRLDSVRPGGFGTLVHNSNGAREGRLILSIFNGTGTTRSVTVAVAHFTAVGSPGEGTLVVQPTVAGNETGQDILPLVAARPTRLCVAGADAPCTP